jgi:hypothetical protein
MKSIGKLGKIKLKTFSDGIIVDVLKENKCLTLQVRKYKK